MLFGLVSAARSAVRYIAKAVAIPTQRKPTQTSSGDVVATRKLGVSQYWALDDAERRDIESFIKTRYVDRLQNPRFNSYNEHSVQQVHNDYSRVEQIAYELSDQVSVVLNSEKERRNKDPANDYNNVERVALTKDVIAEIVCGMTHREVRNIVRSRFK